MPCQGRGVISTDPLATARGQSSQSGPAGRPPEPIYLLIYCRPPPPPSRICRSVNAGRSDPSRSYFPAESAEGRQGEGAGQWPPRRRQRPGCIDGRLDTPTSFFFLTVKKMLSSWVLLFSFFLAACIAVVSAGYTGYTGHAGHAGTTLGQALGHTVHWVGLAGLVPGKETSPSHEDTGPGLREILAFPTDRPRWTHKFQRILTKHRKSQR